MPAAPLPLWCWRLCSSPVWYSLSGNTLSKPATGLFFRGIPMFTMQATSAAARWSAGRGRSCCASPTIAAMPTTAFCGRPRFIGLATGRAISARLPCRPIPDKWPDLTSFRAYTATAGPAQRRPLRCRRRSSKPRWMPWTGARVRLPYITTGQVRFCAP